ncbi:MAG: hypothetical protein GX072_00570 [Lysinibacillus sp.]|nr:hypothetical protein [Lysinibacillus sp.]
MRADVVLLQIERRCLESVWLSRHLFLFDLSKWEFVSFGREIHQIGRGIRKVEEKFAKGKKSSFKQVDNRHPAKIIDKITRIIDKP